MRHAAALAAIGLSFFLVRTAATTVSFWHFADDYEDELAALDHLPEGARLVSFVGMSCRNQWKMTRLEHMPALALERRLAYTNDQWSMPGAQLLTTRYDARGFSHDPSEIVTAYRCSREWWRPINRALLMLPRDRFDYVWLIRPPAYDPRLTTDMRPVWSSGSSVLMKIDHAAAPPLIDPAERVPPLY